MTESRRRRKKNKTPVASTDADSINDIADKNIPLPSTTTPLPSVIPSTSLSPVSTSIDSHDQEVSTIAQEERQHQQEKSRLQLHIKSGMMRTMMMLTILVII